MYCVQTQQLCHSFSAQAAVLQQINLQVPTGSIYGFLGPNGAGKTTTLRLLLGLLKKQEGEIVIFDKPLEKNRVAILKKTGSLIESPSLYGHLTATENLAVLQKIYQCPKERINEVLHLVGLAGTGNKKAGQFSLGMKQRLGIALALLHSPSLLVLDEPTNGLDPNGIIEIRSLLLQLNQQHGITIILSSHLLAEIEKLVSHVGVINKGTMMFQGTLEALKNKQHENVSIVFETDNITQTIQVIRENNLVPQITEGKVIIPAVSKTMTAKIIQQLVNNSVEVYEAGIIKNDLETIFMDLINK
ncbi:ABC transporter ATP-binding protein [Ferruginibacter sp. SUN106]|uniref:ABC transporter ATP-binding protein n=1 Tax=Ferruginibacter sp. SUN106 TaxID=2978348 RepID=UPI003D364E7B